MTSVPDVFSFLNLGLTAALAVLVLQLRKEIRNMATDTKARLEAVSAKMSKVQEEISGVSTLVQQLKDKIAELEVGDDDLDAIVRELETKVEALDASNPDAGVAGGPGLESQT